MIRRALYTGLLSIAALALTANFALAQGHNFAGARLLSSQPLAAARHFQRWP